MPKLTITSTFPSSLIVGDPGFLTINLAPKETKATEVTAVQLRQLTPGLEKLKASGWINYVVVDATAPSAPAEPVKVAPLPPPEPVKPPEPAKPPEPVAPPEPPAMAAPEPEAVVTEEKSEVPPVEEPAPSAPKPVTYDRKNRNR